MIIIPTDRIHEGVYLIQRPLSLDWSVRPSVSPSVDISKVFLANIHGIFLMILYKNYKYEA